MSNDQEFEVSVNPIGRLLLIALAAFAVWLIRLVWWMLP